MKEQHEKANNIAFPLPHPEPPPDINIKCVIDLSKSKRYYDPEAWQDKGVQYIKVPMQGRGEAPTPASVNDALWEVMCQRWSNPGGYILIHCTHGFNRTGYIICQALLRFQSHIYKTVPKALVAFAQARGPGIYKHHYIRDLFKYNHEQVPSDYKFPPLPQWKAGDTGSPDRTEEEEEEEAKAEAVLNESMEHDDNLGEEVTLGEARYIQTFVMDAILGPDQATGGNGRMRIYFPGSQPVSLERKNMDLLRDRRYWVTWKADGTRYLVVIMRWGTYLVDRSMNVRRVQMRWPSVVPEDQKHKSPVGLPQHRTLLDGEMVVDVDAVGVKRRRFLIYDIVSINGNLLSDSPWTVRYKIIQKQVEGPRTLERGLIQEGRWSYGYRYDKEPFGVRTKQFWMLSTAAKLLHDFIPIQVLHESDGLIFQGCDERYVAGTCPELLKWKFAHMNSVDFRLRWHSKDKEWLLELLETRDSSRSGGRSKGYHALPGAVVLFPEGEDINKYDLRIIECCWDGEHQAWKFMRERRDKDTPNAYHVYESVAQSICDNIQEEELLQYIDAAVADNDVYEEDRRVERERAQKRGGGEKE